LDATLPCAFEVLDTKLPDGITSNVSLGGLLVFFPHPVSQGQIVNIKLKLPCSDGDRIFKAQAEIMWIQPNETGEAWAYQAGLRFFEMSPASFEIWKNFLNTWYKP
jgi:c-di-GMP-binding flagellar brake protein YcgR